MTIAGFSNDTDFAKKVFEVLSVSQPVRSIEHLRGRDNELERVRRALLAPGRHVFIFGERGVGKSSLGQTAAIQYQSSDAEPVFVSGSPEDTFKHLIADIASRALGRSKLDSNRKTSAAGFEWGGLNLSRGTEISPLSLVEQINSIGDGASLLAQVAQLHSTAPIVVIDEFDAIESKEERNKFATLLKQLGDQDVNLKFIFTGIGRTLDDLLGAHQSAYRQLDSVELGRLGWDARKEIATNAVEALGLHLHYDVGWRIASISDGFPYFIHLIVEKMLWEAQTDKSLVDELEWTHFRRGLSEAIRGISAELRRPYERAVLHRADEFEDVVWSTADGDDLFRDLTQMFESYKRICRKRERENALDRSRFGDSLRKLKQESFGAILSSVPRRQGWYTYREKMLRGFVRMQAEVSGIELVGDQDAPRQLISVPVSARSGYHGPSVPKGVRLSGDKKSK